MTPDEDLAAELAAEAAAVPPEEAPAPTLERMQQLAEEVNNIDNDIAHIEIQLAELNERRTKILTNELIDMMDQTHVDLLQVGGRKFKASSYYKASIPSDNPEPGLNWLEAHDAGDLIKNVVEVSFAREHAEKAIEAMNLIKQRFQMAAVERKRTVHWATLTSWLKETHLGGEKTMPPLDIIGGTIGRVVKITKEKE